MALPAAGSAQTVPKHLRPVPASTAAVMKAQGMAPSAPILMRIFKKESELEIWKRNGEGRYALLKTFPICRWSGQLGPKRQVGDRQAPEGFYAVTPGLMNPGSAYYLSFDTGYPNAYDRAHGSTGSALMVHGACSSAGCFAMTDEGIAEIYALARDAFAGGQKAFQVQAFPFRMTAENLVRHRTDPNIGFWRQLKEGADRFEATRDEPVVTVTAGRYTFRPWNDPAKEAQVAAYRAQEQDHAAVLLEEGRPAVRTTFEDGGQHPSFAALIRRGLMTAEVSRPEALPLAGREVVLIPAKPAKPAAASVQVAIAPAAASPDAPAVQLPMPAPVAAPHPKVGWFDAEPSALFASVPVGGTATAANFEAPQVLGALPRVRPQLTPQAATLAAL
jgi:murein L,D-transpeptidase YafK